MVRLKREESQARTRALLLEAGRTQVVTRGFAEASVRDIAEAAGFSQGAFYSNFESKEALLLELLDTQKKTELDAISAALDGITEPREATAALDHWIDAMNDQRDWAVLAVELELHAARNPEFGKAYAKLAREHVGLVGKLIARIFKVLGAKPPASPDELASGFIALCHGLILQQPRLSPAAFRAIYRSFCDAILPKAKAP